MDSEMATTPTVAHSSELQRRAQWPVRAWLILLVLACLIPGLIGSALLVYHDYQTSRTALERSSLLTTRALLQAVDDYLLRTQAVAQSLAQSSELRAGNFAGLYGESRAFLSVNGLASSISVSDAQGQLIFNTSREFGVSLPKHGNPQQIRRVLDTGEPAISNLYHGNVSQQLVVSIDVPVVIQGKPTYVLSAALRPEIFRTFLQGQELPPQWLAAIFDTEGTFVARSLAPDQFVGKKPSAELTRRSQLGSQGVFESVTPDGFHVLTVFSRSAKTGWFVALGIPYDELNAQYVQPLRLLAAGTLLLFVAGLGLAWWMGERMAASVRALADQAHALGQGQPLSLPPVHIRESQEVSQALVNAAALLQVRSDALEAERKSREAQLERVVAERTRALQDAIQESERLARSDALTGLQNRRSASEQLRAEYQRMCRSGIGYAALLLDIDHFKRINDTFGHEVGDSVLREIAVVLAATVRLTDFIARFGGEEFLVLLPQTDVQGAQVIAEKLRGAVAQTPFSTVQSVTISVGVSCATPEDASEQDVLRRADNALYEAKGEGRNCVCVR